MKEKFYTYNGINYKRANDQWFYYNPNYKTWNYVGQANGTGGPGSLSVNGMSVENSSNLENYHKQSAYAKSDWWKEHPSDPTVSATPKKSTTSPEAYREKRSQVLSNPFMTTQQKLDYVKGSPLVETPEIVSNLNKTLQAENAQKEKENQLKLLEQQRQQNLRTVGSDNTFVDNSIVKNNSFYIPNIFEQTMSITKAQKDAARQITMSGDLAKHYPELWKEYMSEENSNREGGPLTLEEIALREIRTNPDFLTTLQSRKEADWKRREQKAYDSLAWWEKGLNAAQAFIADPIMVTGNALFRGEGPMVGQGQWSIDPEKFSGEDSYYYDKFSGKSKSTFNNMFNIVNVGRAGAGAGMALGEGDYGDAAYELATVIPMVKGAKYGWKGLNALMKTKPLSYVPGLATTGWGAMTTGQALTGYGLYHAGAYDFPEAFDAYSKGDYGTGNEKAFMGLINSVPFVAEAKAGLPSVYSDLATVGNKVKQGYNTVAQGESVLPIAWKSAAAGMNQENSAAMFDKVLNSSKFTDAEKALIREHQYSSFPFQKAGPQQDKMNALIEKINAVFPENAVATRKFYGDNAEVAFQSVKGEPGNFTEFSIQDRPTAFSTGVGSEASWGKDRIVLSGRNLKKVEGNIVKNTYEPVSSNYYASVPDDGLIVADQSKNAKDSWSFSEKVGDNYYGTSRLTPEEINAQAEALYNRRVADFNNPENSRFMKPNKVEDFAGKSKDGSANNLYTQEEAEAIVADQTKTYNQRKELYGDSANKDKAIAAIKDENKLGFSGNSKPLDERELIGSGFDMKVVGKVKNELGGTDYIVQPRNIRKLKTSSTQSEPVELEPTPMPSKISDKPVTYGESSDLTIGPDKQSGMKYTRIADEAEKQKLLNEFPEKITTVYREQWPSKGYESADDFPMSRAGQQQALDESTDFALKWAFKDSDVFKKADKILAPSIKRLNEIKGTNDPSGGLYKKAVESLNRQLRSINAQDQDDAIKEFLKLNPDKTIADIGDHTSELVQILAKQNPNNGIMQRLLQTSESVLDMEKEAKQLHSTIGEQMKIVEANVDPKFKDKILKIYEDTMRDDPARFDEIKTKIDEPYASGIADKFTGLEDKIKLVHPAKHEPSFQSLSPFEKMYVANNYDNIGGVAMDNSTITLGSKPNTLANQFMGVVIPETETLETASDPKVIHFIDQYMKAPDRIAEINTHELGHNFQKFFGNWISRLQQNDPSYGYFVTRQDPKSELLTMMKEVMVEPTVPTADSKMVTSMTDQTWLAAPNELHSDLMIARYKLAKELMKTYKISMEEAIANIKDPKNEDYYAEWLMKDPEVAPHFKPDAPDELKAGIIKYLPILIPAVGYGVMQGMNSETPKNKYGGNIKTLSKFIRK